MPFCRVVIGDLKGTFARHSRDIHTRMLLDLKCLTLKFPSWAADLITLQNL